MEDKEISIIRRNQTPIYLYKKEFRQNLENFYALLKCVKIIMKEKKWNINKV